MRPFCVRFFFILAISAAMLAQRPKQTAPPDGAQKHTGNKTQPQPCQDPCGEPTAWQEFNSFSLKVTAKGQPGYSTYQGSFDKETGDIQIDVENSQSDSINKGKILMIGGRVMATRGPITEPGYEIDALDGAILELQLVTKLLGRAVPEGPANIMPSRHVDYADAKVGIQFATPSADGMIEAPWSVVGQLKRGSGGSVEYDLTLRCRGSQDEEKATTMSFTGKLFNVGGTKINDNMSLAGWGVLGVGPHSRKQDGSTIIDYSAAPETTAYKTVADVREKLAADDYPGEPDASKNFTGFWKTNCEDAFGLQIKHYGLDGRYSIVFCGPGGCGDPENSRLTFISKDSRYQVINDDELKEQTLSGWDTYHRCTKETNPVLKYKKK